MRCLRADSILYLYEIGCMSMPVFSGQKFRVKNSNDEAILCYTSIDDNVYT